MQEEIVSSVKKPWKKIVIGTVLLLVFITGVFLLWILYLYTPPQIPGIHETPGTTIACKKSGGTVKNQLCGSSCWQGYPLTKDERIKIETIPRLEEYRSCIDSCSQNVECKCQPGYYFGSIEEGCIDNSERRNPE